VETGDGWVYETLMTKTLTTLSLAVALVLVAACGPSSAELKSAQDTTYSGAPATLFAAMKSAVEDANNKIHTSNDGELTVETLGVWYTPEGQIDTMIDNNIARLQDDSINIAYSVKLAQAGTATTYKVQVVPVIGRKHGLSSAPDKIDPDDPSLPGWVAGKANSLRVHIHDKMAMYATAGGTPPVTGAPAPAPAPASPAPAAPAPAAAPAAPAPAAPAP